MKLLVVTQKVDATDTNLGFFVRWIERFSAQCESVLVVCLEQGTYVLPPNVRVLSLGKERLRIKDQRLRILPRVLYILRLLRYIVIERGNYDAVFIHMNPEYVLLGGLVWKMLSKKTALWYVHKEVSWRLRLAALFVNMVFTASPESCRLKNKKVTVVGHGVTAEFFAPHGKAPHGLRLVTAGRIAPVKDIQTLILGFLELKKRFPDATLSIVGEPITNADRAHLEELRRISPEARFLGGVSHEELPRFLGEATVFVHASRTGSMDKAVLEALAAGLQVFTSSEAFLKPQMDADGEDANTRRLETGIRAFREGDPADFAEKISRAFLQGELVINTVGSAYVRESHSLSRLVQKIIAFYSRYA